MYSYAYTTFMKSKKKNKFPLIRRNQILRDKFFFSGIYEDIYSPYTASNNTYVLQFNNLFRNNYVTPFFIHQFPGYRLHTAFNSLFYLGDPQAFKFLMYRLFWNMKVTDHRFILLWLRRVYKDVYANKHLYNILGLSIFIKGKLGVTGNKRTRTFKLNYGPNSSTNKTSKTLVDYFTVRTNTGVVGFTLSITYNH